jgi:Na+-transporting NADH:ubiquinone oxidoreductase subunit NqrD
LKWISSTTLGILGWIETISAQPETILLTGVMLFLVVALSVGLVFALDREEPHSVRTIAWLLLIVSASAIGYGAIGLAS